MAPALSDTAAYAPRRKARRPMSGRLPATRSGPAHQGGTNFATIHNRERKLRPYERTDGDVLALLKVKPRDLFDVARALDIHTALASAALDSLTRQGLAVKVDELPTRWGAV